MPFGLPIAFWSGEGSFHRRTILLNSLGKPAQCSHRTGLGTFQPGGKGVHVFCEKPLACTFADAERLRDQAAGDGLVLQVGYFRRFHPTAQVLYDLLRNGELGNPLGCTFNGGHVFNPPASLMNPSISGGGVLMDFGVHIFDRLLSWFDSFEIDDYADDACGGLEANCIVKGCARVNAHSLPVELHLSRTSELGYFSVIVFEQASVTCPLDTGHALDLESKDRSAEGGDGRRLLGELKIEPNRDCISYFCEQFLEFRTRIYGGDETYSNLDDAVRVNALVDRCYGQRNHLTFPSGW